MGYIINPYNYAATGETKFVMEIEVEAGDLNFTWKTGGSGATAPLYTIDWGDGTIDVDQTGDKLHTYSAAGSYDIKVSGKSYVRPYGTASNRTKIKNLKNWGTADLEITYMAYAFSGATNMVYTATDYPNISPNFSGGIAQLFYNCDLITSLDLSNWQNTDRFTGNAASAFRELRDCTLIDLTGWDVSNITTGGSMFSYTGYNTGIGGTEIKLPNMNWASMTSVNAFNTMFQRVNAVVDLSNWTLPSSGTGWFNSAFYFAGYGAGREFRTAGAGNVLDLSSWNNTNWINRLINTFAYNSNATEINLTGWDFSNVETYSGIFNSCTVLEEIPGMQNFRLVSGSLTSNMTTNMFYNCKKLDFTNYNLSAQFITDYNAVAKGVNSGMFLNTGASNPSPFKTGPNIVGMNLCGNGVTSIQSWMQSVNLAGDYKPILAALPVNGTTQLNMASAFYISNDAMGSGILDLSGWTLVFAPTVTSTFRTMNLTTVDLGNNLDFSNVSHLSHTFYGNPSLTSIIWPTGLDLTNLTVGTNMISGSMGTSNYDHFLDRMSTTWNNALTAGSLSFGTTQYTKSILTTGTATSTTANKLVDSSKDFSASGLNVQVNDIVFDDTGNDYARVTAVDNATTLSLNADIIISGDAYEIDQGAAAKDKEYLIDNGWTIVDANGTSN